MSRENNVRRREFLRTVAATGAFVGATGLSTAQIESTSIELDASRDGWVGVSPASIQGVTNPTLDLEPGTDYTVTWTNRDGEAHNFVVEDANGAELVRSPIMSQQGQTQTVNFTATQEMAEYFCEVHPASMRGQIGGGGAGGGTRVIPEGPTIGLERVAGGFDAPVGFEVAEVDSDELPFVADQTGQIYNLDEGGGNEGPFLDIADRMVDVGQRDPDSDVEFDERGLLGLAFHPEFDDNGKFYVRYSAPPREGTPDDYDHTFVLSEFQAADGGERADPDSERTLLEIPQPQFNHNSGAIAFGPDDYLYVTVGDGGGADDTGPGHVEDWYDENAGGNGQDVTENLLGSILRIDVDSREDGKPYGIPDDNPLVGTEGLDEQYAWGFRNPWRMSFDDDGRLFVGDVQQNLYEEVDIVEKGGNYGWNVREGTHCFSTDSPNDPPAECPTHTPDSVRGGEPLLDPIIEYPHSVDGQAVGTTVIGGHFYDDSEVDAIDDKYVFGDWSRSFSDPRGRLFAATPPEDGGMWSMEELVVEGTSNGEINRFVLAFGQDADDQLYVLTSQENKPTGGTGEVFRIVPADGA